MELRKTRNRGGLNGNEEIWLLTEMVCILKSVVPVGEEFQNSLDRDYGFPPSMTRLREQVTAGMRNLVIGSPEFTAEFKGSHLDDVFIENSRFIKDILLEHSKFSISELTTESGFYFLLTWPHSDTYSPAAPLWVSLLYYDGTSNSAVFITLKTSESSPSMMTRFADAVWAPGKDTFSRFYYLGKSCSKGAGIINWLW